jgi:acetylornithine deacetylase/succinyl-diaminopimelate desuccinylase-like protein
LVKIPSVSADPKFKDDVLRAAEYLKNQFEKAGMENVAIIAYGWLSGGVCR